jgi:hypothetical protein
VCELFLVFEFVSTDNQYNRKVIKRTVRRSCCCNSRGHQTIDFPIKTAILQHVHHFEKVLKSNVKLSLQQYKEIEDLNSALANNDLFIAMVRFCEFLGRFGMYCYDSKLTLYYLFFNSAPFTPRS